MCLEVQDGRMTYEVEIESSNHNNSYFELRNRTLDALQDILQTHSSASQLDIVVSSYDNAREKSKFHWKSRNVRLDLLTFRRVPHLKRLCLQMNRMIGLSVSQPFYMAVRELSLADVELDLYNFTMLIRAVGQTLAHMSMRNCGMYGSNSTTCTASGSSRLEGAPALLTALERVRRLESLRVDTRLSALLPVLRTHLRAPLTSLFLHSADLNEVVGLEEAASLTANLFVEQLRFQDRTFQLSQVRDLQLAMEDLRRKTRPRDIQIRLVLGVPKTWNPDDQHSSVRPLAAIGQVQVCTLVEDGDLLAIDEDLVQTLIRLWL